MVVIISKLLSVLGIDYIRFLGVELELAYNGGSCGEIYSKNQRLMSFQFEKTPCISLGFKLHWVGSVGLCSKNEVLCIQVSPIKPEYYAQNYARLEV